MNKMDIVSASEVNCAEVAIFLKKHGLPIADIDASLQGFFVAKHENEIVGTIGVEEYRAVGLLRSLAVDKAHRGHALGKRLVNAAVNHAKTCGIEVLYMLTTTADKYFEKHGFQHIRREDVPDLIQRTEQFSRLCPTSAIIMKRLL